MTELGFPTRKQKPCWERSVIWAILRNPAYQGRACFGKTAVTTRQCITRPLRLRGGLPTRNSANHELPHEKWIEIPVPTLVSEETFTLPQEKLIYNKLHELRRTIEDSSCIFTERCLSRENAGFPTSRRVICVPSFQPLTGLIFVPLDFKNQNQYNKFVLTQNS